MGESASEAVVGTRIRGGGRVGEGLFYERTFVTGRQSPTDDIPSSRNEKKSILFFFTNCTKSIPTSFRALCENSSLAAAAEKNAAGVFARAARSVLASSRLEKKVLPPTKSQRRRSRGLQGILLLARSLAPFA